MGTQANFRLDAKSVHRCTARCKLRNGPREIENGAVSVVVALEDASLVDTRKKGRYFSQAKDAGLYLSRIQFRTSIHLQASLSEIIRCPDQKDCTYTKR